MARVLSRRNPYAQSRHTLVKMVVDTPCESITNGQEAMPGDTSAQNPSQQARSGVPDDSSRQRGRTVSMPNASTKKAAKSDGNIVEPSVRTRNYQQRQHARKNQAAHYNDPKGLTKLRTTPQGQRDG